MKKFIAFMLIFIFSFSIKVFAINNSNKNYNNKQNFIKDYYINGPFFEINEIFKIEEWNINKAVLDLNFSLTDFVEDNLSSFTIAINGVKFKSIKINNANQEIQNITFNIPIKHIVKGLNTLTISAYIRTEDQLPCIDDVISSNWLNVFKESLISIDYQLNTKINTIADFYEDFTSINSLDYKKSAFVINILPDCEELTATFTALSGISRNADKNYNNIGFENNFNKQNIIYISKYSKLNQDILEYFTEEQKLDALNSGIITLIKKENQNILVVTSNNNILLNLASKLLSNPTLMMQLNNTYKIINFNENVSIAEKDEWQYISITEKGTYTKGPFRKNIDFYIDYPKNRTIADFSELYLNFRYSENLDFDRSLVTAYINDIPIGSKKLSKDKAQEDEFLFKIPTDINIYGNFNLKIAFDLEIKDLWCSLRQQEMPWAYITNKSMLKLNYIENPFIFFENYPAPFIKNGSMNKIAIVIPDNINDINYDFIVPIMLTMGQYLKDNNGELKVVSASKMESLDNYNIITIGTFKNNSFIRDLNDELFFKFSADGSIILSNKKMLLDKNYSTQIGIAELLKSPFSSNNNALLVLSGVSDKSIYNAVKYINSTENLWKIQGDAYVADDENVFNYRFNSNKAVSLVFDNSLSESNNLVVSSITAIMIIVLIIFSIILMLNKYNRKIKHNRSKNNEK